MRPVFQIAQHGHGQAIKMTQFLADREEVEQGLGGMFAGAIARIDDRLAAIPGSRRGCTGIGVAQDDDVRIALKGPHRVRQRLAFGNG